MSFVTFLLWFALFFTDFSLKIRAAINNKKIANFFMVVDCYAPIDFLSHFFTYISSRQVIALSTPDSVDC